MNRADLRGALEDNNVRAFLRVIREGESGQAASAYRMRYGGVGNAPKYFDDLSRHPKIFERTRDGLMSSAAGAYQATWTTWVETASRWGLTDFSEQSQDEFAVARLIFRDALEDVKAGRFEEACRKCSTEWTSLPGGNEQNAATKRARETWDRWREILADAPPINADPLATEHYGEAVTESTINPVQSADEQEANMEPFAISFLAGLAGKLIEGFAPLAQEKAAKAIARHTDNPQVAGQVAGILVDAAKMVTGKADEVAAVAAARADPAMMARVQEIALEGLAKIAPVLDKVAELDAKAWAAEEASRDAASKRAAADPNDQGPFLTRSSVYGVFGLLVLMTILAGVLASLGKSVGEVLTFITTVGGVIVGGYKTVIDHRFGSSRSSSAKDIVISELSRRRT